MYKLHFGINLSFQTFLDEPTVRLFTLQQGTGGSCQSFVHLKQSAGQSIILGTVKSCKNFHGLTWLELFYKVFFRPVALQGIVPQNNLSAGWGSHHDSTIYIQRMLRAHISIFLHRKCCFLSGQWVSGYWVSWGFRKYLVCMVKNVIKWRNGQVRSLRLPQVF